MAQSKYNCTNCRRLIPIQNKVCPFCGTPNSSNNQSNARSNASTTTQQPKSTQNPGVPASVESRSQQEKVTPNPKKVSSLSIDDIGDLLNMDANTEETIQEQFVSEPKDMSSENYAYGDVPYSLDKEENETENDHSDVNGGNEKIISDAETGISEDSNINKRSPIDWNDEKEKEIPDYSKMYDEQGQYNFNFDGYYDDVMPKITNEIDSILAGREKAILKVIFSIVGIFAIIIYLILTL